MNKVFNPDLQMQAVPTLPLNQAVKLDQREFINFKKEGGKFTHVSYIKGRDAVLRSGGSLATGVLFEPATLQDGKKLLEWVHQWVLRHPENTKKI